MNHTAGSGIIFILEIHNTNHASRFYHAQQFLFGSPKFSHVSNCLIPFDMNNDVP